MSTLRYILVNDSRDDALQKAFAFATGGQDGLMMFNTSAGELHHDSRNGVRLVIVRGPY
jgi:hypothetical protein